MKDIVYRILGVFFVVGAVLGLVALAAHAQDRDQATCERRGGVYIQERGGYLCLNPEALK